MAYTRWMQMEQPGPNTPNLITIVNNNFAEIDRGRSFFGTAGQAINEFDPVYQGSDGLIHKAIAGNGVLGLSAMSVPASGADVRVVTWGFAYNPLWGWSPAASGGPVPGSVYVDPTGVLTQNPNASGEFIGVAITATDILILPASRPHKWPRSQIVLVVPADPGVLVMASVQVASPRPGKIVGVSTTCRTAPSGGTYTYNVTKNGSPIYTSGKPTRSGTDGTARVQHALPQTVTVAEDDVFAVNVEGAGTGIADLCLMLKVETAWSFV